MKKSNSIIAISLLLITALGLSNIANAALISRLGGLAYYDDVADLTWLADANAGAGSIYDDLQILPHGTFGTTTDGLMSWASANAWAASLNVEGVTGWRLPDTLQPDASCDTQDSNGSYGYNCTGSEMGNLFYNVLGGVADFELGKVHNANYDLFSVPEDDVFLWSATENSLNNANAWYFSTFDGWQTHRGHKEYAGFLAWGVHSGDVAVSSIPIPASIWLFISGIAGLFPFFKKMKRV